MRPVAALRSSLRPPRPAGAVEPAGSTHLRTGVDRSYSCDLYVTDPECIPASEMRSGLRSNPVLFKDVPANSPGSKGVTKRRIVAPPVRPYKGLRIIPSEKLLI